MFVVGKPERLQIPGKVFVDKIDPRSDATRPRRARLGRCSPSTILSSPCGRTLSSQGGSL
ncbi:hypothetical protein E2C01_019286 [Portunus trituberculatus]|uniref:Uncharacterized protein n=1 Tax=Portunus trituberculatus TaxID=210409 RepID=A0A5B7DZ02_PORTR|nr:hypothetical protein [Portunus trituberculatus]